MPKGPIITPEVEALIASVYRKHPDWKAPKIRNEVEAILLEKKLGFPRGWPGLSAVQKVLAVARKPPPPLREWSLDTLDDEPIPLEALPLVFRLCKQRIESGNSFTTRDAKWAARLSVFWQDIDILDMEVERYSYAESVFESIKRPFNSRWLDRSLMGINVELEGSDLDEALTEYSKRADYPGMAALGGAMLYDWKPTKEAQDEGSSVRKSINRRPRKGRNKPRKSA